MQMKQDSVARIFRTIAEKRDHPWMKIQNCDRCNEMKRCARSRNIAYFFHIFHGPPPNLARTKHHHHLEKGRCQGAQIRWLKSPTIRKLAYRLPMIPEN